MRLTPFHLAFCVTDLVRTREFYETILGCSVGRTAERWIDFNCFGHQISAHLVDEGSGAIPTNAVDGDAVPVPHFGVVLRWDDWQVLADRLRQHDVPFLLGPRIRFEGQPGEQGTFFVRDPCGNALEFKSFRDPHMLFAT